MNGRPLVLVIDDDVGLGKLIARTLADDYDVLVLTRAHEVVDRVAAGERFDVILCDLMLPGMSGADLYERVAVMAPELVERVIIMSGGAFTPRTVEFLARSGLARLDKPFRVSALRAVVRGLVRRTRMKYPP